MRSLDTNTILRLGLHDVPAQADRIITLIESSTPGSLMVADVALFECAWVLRNSLYHFDRLMIGKFLSNITNIPQINCNRSMFERALDIYVDNPSLSLIDACLAIYAEINNAVPLLTFDKKLAKALPKTVTLV